MSAARRKALGRGLDALLEQKPAAPAQPLTLPIAALVPNRRQPRSRFAEDGLEELAASIREQGIVQPIVVTPGPGGKHTIVAGERRWRAASRAGLKEVPVTIRESLTDQQFLELALVENLQRSDLDAIEEAEAYRALQTGFGLSQEAIAQRVGKSRAAVTNTLRLLKLPEPIRDLISDGRLTAGQARPLIGLAEEAQLKLAKRAVDQGLSARDLERLAAGKPTKPKPTAARIDPNTAAAAEKLTKKLRTKVEIHRRGRSAAGTLRLHFHSEEELIGLYDLLMKAKGGA